MKYRYSIDYLGPGIGIALFLNEKYVATYLSFNDCLIDMAFHWGIDEIENLKNEVKEHSFDKVNEPFQYRAICTEYFYPTERIINYVFFSDSMSDIIEKCENIEMRSLEYPNHFSFAPQGVGIHLFNNKTLRYEFWTGGNSIKSISELIFQLHNTKKFVPDKLIKEFRENDCFDVFLSHKSEDFVVSKKLYNYLTDYGFKVFLSEVSLPAISNADYASEIDYALEVSKNLIVVCSSLENILSGWIKFEWTAFANELKSERKNGNLLTYNVGHVDISSFPLTLRQYEVLNEDTQNQIPFFLKR